MELTVAQVASGRLPSHPAAFVGPVLPATVDVPVDKARILTADEQHLEMVAEVFQFHPKVREQSVKESKVRSKVSCRYPSYCSSLPEFPVLIFIALLLIFCAQLVPLAGTGKGENAKHSDASHQSSVVTERQTGVLVAPLSVPFLPAPGVHQPHQLHLSVDTIHLGTQ